MDRRVRTWVFRIATALVLPLLLALAVEGGLRLVSYGHPGGFTLACTVGGRRAFCENDRFTWQFFPAGLFRLPYSFAIPADRQPNSFRIIVIGESAAQGVPQPSYAFARFLEVMLRDRFPAMSFEVINTSISSINSHVLLPVARDLARRQADLFVLYLGNNEVVGPFGPQTTLTPRRSSLTLIRAGIALRSTRLGQLMASAVHRVAGREEPREWRGIRMFLERQVPADAPAMMPVYHSFEQNLRDIVGALRTSGAPVLLSTVGANLKDCAPFGSLHRPDLTVAERDRWDSLVAGATALDTTGRSEAALEQFLAAAAIDDRHAELQFRIGRTLWRLGRFEAAEARYARARDLDVLRFRADGTMNQIIRSVARDAGPGVELVDGEAVFRAASPHGVPGRELFYEHVHLNPHGNYLLARALYPRVVSRLAAAVREGREEPPSETEAERLLALTSFDRGRIAREVGLWLSQPPFIYQLNHQEQVRELAREADAAGDDPDATREAYRWAVAQAPDDRWLHFNYGVFLESRDPAAALAEFRSALDLLPGDYLAREKLVDVLLRMERFDEALTQSRELLRRMPYHAPVHLTIGYALARLGRLDESIAAYQHAIALQPSFAVEAYNQIGIIQLHQQRFAPAAASFQRAMQLDTGRVRAGELRYNLDYARAGLARVRQVGRSPAE